MALAWPAAVPYHQAMPKEKRPVFQAGIACVLLAVAAVEGWYGRPELLGDDICYLDVVNLLRHGDWKAALNPLWSLGYPLLLSLVRPAFGSSMHGELLAVFWLNLCICLASWLCFLWLIRAMFATTRGEAGSHVPLSRFALLAAAFVFLFAELGMGRVSSIGPDQLVTCLFFAASALTLRFIAQPTRTRGAMLGAVLGLGYVAKAIFLPLGLLLLGTAFAGAFQRHRAALRLMSALAATVPFLLLIAVYAIPLSWAFGRPTLGESGALNYALHVNQLPHWMGWQGTSGDAALGVPKHPLPLVFKQPPVFAFPEPFHVTYPPDYAMPYWYDGYRHFFDLHRALAGFATNQHILLGLVHSNQDVLLAIALCGAFALALRPPRGRFSATVLRDRARDGWPLFLPSLLGILLYLQIHLESRYIAPFVAVLCVLPVLAFAGRASSPLPARHPRLAIALLALLAATVGWQLWVDDNPAVRLRLRHADLESEGQWRIAQALAATGLRPGDQVASVNDYNDIRCTWAYAARLHIVAHLGNDAYDPAPADQLRDLHQFFDDPATQARVLDVFRQAGAVAVVAPEMPFDVRSRGWQSIPGTHAWFLMLR
jgi:hypothetical protein